MIARGIPIEHDLAGRPVQANVKNTDKRRAERRGHHNKGKHK